MNSKIIKLSLFLACISALFVATQAAAAKAPPADKGCPTGDCPAKAGGGDDGGCPTGECEIPPDPDTNRAVQLPDQIQTEPTKVIPTGEKQIATDIIDYHTTRHITQPTERHHRVQKHRHQIKRHFLRIVYHPTYRRINSVVRSGSAEEQVMPTEEVIAPTVDYGCANAVPVPVCGGAY